MFVWLHYTGNKNGMQSPDSKKLEKTLFFWLHFSTKPPPKTEECVENPRKPPPFNWKIRFGSGIVNSILNVDQYQCGK